MRLSTYSASAARAASGAAMPGRQINAASRQGISFLMTLSFVCSPRPAGTGRVGYRKVCRGNLKEMHAPGQARRQQPQCQHSSG